MLIRVVITSAINHRLTHPIIGFILMITFLQLSGYVACDSRVENLDPKHISLDKNEENWISTLLNSFIEGNNHEEINVEVETGHQTTFNVTLQNVRNYLVKSVSEKVNFEEHAEKENQFYYDFEILKPYTGKHKKLFEWMVQELQRDFRLSIRNCKSRTTKEFRGWIERDVKNFVVKGTM